MLGMSWIYPLSNSILHHYIFTISHLWLIPPNRSALFLLDTGTPGTSRGEMINMLWCNTQSGSGNSIPCPSDCCHFEFGRVIIERGSSNFLLQKQPKLYAWSLWAYCDRNLLSIYPECNISLTGVKWFKPLSHIHSRLVFLCGFCNRKSDELPVLYLWVSPVQSRYIISNIEGMQYNWGTLSAQSRHINTIKGVIPTKI